MMLRGLCLRKLLAAHAMSLPALLLLLHVFILRCMLLLRVFILQCMLLLRWLLQPAWLSLLPGLLLVAWLLVGLLAPLLRLLATVMLCLLRQGLMLRWRLQ